MCKFTDLSVTVGSPYIHYVNATESWIAVFKKQNENPVNLYI
jgi:hypothetical protein